MYTMFIGILSLLGLVAASVPIPRLFCYWEAWNQLKMNDFANELYKVPIKSSSNQGCDVVIIAFNDFKLSSDSTGKTLLGYINEQSAADNALFDHAKLKYAISEVHGKGAKVYLSLGGSTFSTAGVITTIAEANTFIDSLGLALKSYDFDGVDFSHIDPESSAAIQTRMIKRLACKYPAYKIMYTIPAGGSHSTPWSKVLQDAGDKIDYVQSLFYNYYVADYDLDTDLSYLISTIRSKHMLVIGIMPECHDAETEPVTTVKQAKELAQKVIDEDYKGIAIWSANRDTDSREGYDGCPYFTGKPDATFIKAVSKKLGQS
jgi:chitinase